MCAGVREEYSDIHTAVVVKLVAWIVRDIRSRTDLLRAPISVTNCDGDGYVPDESLMVVIPHRRHDVFAIPDFVEAVDT